MTSHSEIKAVLESLRRVYTRMTYREFCTLLDLNARYDMEYFEKFHEGVEGLFRLDDDNLVKLIQAWQEAGVR